MKMTLNEALVVLATVHTRDDSVVGFVVHSGLTDTEYIGVSHKRWFAAWNVVREHLHMQTEPQK